MVSPAVQAAWTRTFSQPWDRAGLTATDRLRRLYFAQGYTAKENDRG